MTEPRYRPRRAAGPYPLDAPEAAPEIGDDPGARATGHQTASVTPIRPMTESVPPAPPIETPLDPPAARPARARAVVPSWYGPQSSPPARTVVAPPPADPPAQATPAPAPAADASPYERFGPPTHAVGLDGTVEPTPAIPAFARPAEPPVPDPVLAPSPTAAPAPAPSPPPVVERPPVTTGRLIAPIEVRGLTKSFGSVLAVDDLSFSVQPGRVTGFLGPNGAGKTTTLRTLVGLATPTRGSATFGGRAYRQLSRPQQTVGAALDATFHPGRTGRDHLRVLAATAGAGDRRVDELLELVELTAAGRRRVGGYSLGMRQRLALATALLGDPDYLILDEPANGLDPEGIRWLRGFLRTVAGDGKVVLVSSHALREVQQTVDDVVVISHGRLLRSGPIGEIETAEPSARVRVAHLDPAVGVLTAAGLDVQTDIDAEGPYLRVRTIDTARIGGLLHERGIAVVELTREQFDLEQSFFRMLEREAGIPVEPAIGPGAPR